MKWDGSIIFMGTEDLDQTDHFYRDILGLKLYKDQGACLIYQIPGGGIIGFCNHIEVQAVYRSPIITLLTSEVDQVYSLLKEADIEVAEEPSVNPDFNIYHFFTKDPNGYTVEVQKFLD